ncbi:MAG: histidine kinase dimerization/phosphoacceptor domain -containing protein [Methanobacteriota archaeon]
MEKVGYRAYIGTITDITERKHAEEQLKESLKEKEILLREIHHRVKNNMQVISSLLMLQEELSEDEKVIEMLKDSQNRITSMALIHEKLYRSENLSKIDLKEYIDDLVSGLFQSYGISEDKVALNINAENVLLEIDSAIPCGLIINELVSNSLKHAFPEDEIGEINIFIRSTDEDMFEFLIGDNGVGIPKDLDFRKTESLGLRIVNILVENQLHGEITLNRAKGTEFKIKFRGMK